MPLRKSLGADLWEVRSSLPSSRIARVFLCVRDGHLIALHGFIKKTQKSPQAELDLAKRRMKEIAKS
jgi:phage-related protein